MAAEQFLLTHLLFSLMKIIVEQVLQMTELIALRLKSQMERQGMY